MMTDFVEYKVLPFELQDGTKVPGHAILAFPQVEKVVFWTFDKEADMSIEIVVPVQQWTKFLHRCSPHKSHTHRAVILKDGTRINTTSLTCRFSHDNQWDSAPRLAQLGHTIARLGDRTPLVTIAGVTEWFWSDRKDPSIILDPWARDNEIFYTKFPHLRPAS